MTKKAIEYLDSEREKIWASIVEMQSTLEVVEVEISDLGNAVKKKTSDYESDAKQSAQQAATHKTRTSNLLNEVKAYHEEAQNYSKKIIELKDNIPAIEELCNKIKATSDEAQHKLDLINQTSEAITSKQENTLNDLNIAEESLTDTKNVNIEIQEYQESVESIYKKISTAHSQALNKSTEIKNTYDKIFGYTYEDDETGEEKSVAGQKEELDLTYEALKTKIDTLTSELVQIKEQQDKDYTDFLDQKNTEAEELKDKIRNLLPEAMTAGLSHAYENKRTNEETVLRNSKRTFNSAILFLSITAIIPMIVGYFFMKDGKTIYELIVNLPRIVLGIIPIYLPLFWFAVTANKNVKLSKRLIEEYSHKESLAKTFEGLSTQIKNLDDDEASIDLRTRLLYNIINASSENPGNLIKDFHRSDNPVLNVLDKSLAFSNSLEKLSSIPGIEIILQKVAKQREHVTDIIGNSVEESVAAEETLSEEDED